MIYMNPFHSGETNITNTIGKYLCYGGITLIVFCGMFYGGVKLYDYYKYNKKQLEYD